jgi:hypothetical protein
MSEESDALDSGETMSAVAKKKEREATPKAMAPRYEALIAVTDRFCKAHLTDEYAELARRAMAALCRKRPSPVAEGAPESWALGVLYALGQINFLFDKASSPYIAAQDLCAMFGLAPGTGNSKAKAVRTALGIRQFDHRWTLPSRVENSPGIWLVNYRGLVVNARGLSRGEQMQAAAAGVIPYVPADGPDGHGGDREVIFEGYDARRRINMRHQTAMAERLRKGPVAEAAVRLGLAKTVHEAAKMKIEDLAAAADVVLYGSAPDAANPIRAYLDDDTVKLGDHEREVLEAMSSGAFFSLFRVRGCHRAAGVDIVDLLSGDGYWLMDRGLDFTAHAGLEFACRIFKMGDFWMSTGVSNLLDREMWALLKGAGIRKTPKGVVCPITDRNALAETLCRLAVAA